MSFYSNDKDEDDDLQRMIQKKQEMKRPQSSPGTMKHLRRAPTSPWRPPPSPSSYAAATARSATRPTTARSSAGLPGPTHGSGSRRVKSAAARRTPDWDKHAVTGVYRDVARRPLTATGKTVQQRVWTAFSVLLGLSLFETHVSFFFSLSCLKCVEREREI